MKKSRHWAAFVILFVHLSMLSTAAHAAWGTQWQQRLQGLLRKYTAAAGTANRYLPALPFAVSNGQQKRAIQLRRRVAERKTKMRKPLFAAAGLTVGLAGGLAAALWHDQHKQSPSPQMAWETLPLYDTHRFLGREELLAQLEQKLQPASAKEQTTGVSILCGSGGIGKTTLALFYAYTHFRNDYNTVLWINAENQASLEASLRAAARNSIILPNRSLSTVMSLSMVKHHIKRKLHSCPGWLIVLDNADDSEILNDLVGNLCPEQGGSVIITSRCNQWPQFSHDDIFYVNAFTPEEASKTLNTRYRKPWNETDRQYMEKLTKELGYWPLAVVNAGIYIQRSDRNYKSYWELYEENKEYLLKKEDTDLLFGYNRKNTSFFKAFKDSLSILKSQSKEVFKIALAMSYFSDNKIGNNIIPNNMRNELRTLENYNIIYCQNEDGRAWTVPPLQRRLLKNLSSDQENYEAALEAAKWLHNVWKSLRTSFFSTQQEAYMDTFVENWLNSETTHQLFENAKRKDIDMIFELAKKIARYNEETLRTQQSFDADLLLNDLRYLSQLYK